jgi:hypothetical protein
MLDLVAVEAVHLVTVMVQVTVVLLEQAAVVVQQVNHHLHMVVMEIEAVVELDNILQGVEEVLVVEVEKELLVVLLLVETELKFQF